MMDFSKYVMFSGAVGAVGAFGILFFIIFIISFILKGLALWFAAKKNDTWWFIGLLIINTAGIGELVYMLFFNDTAKAWLKSKVGYKNSNKKEEPTKE